jgi:tetratricopeptide (TPR) repeat protein
VGEAVSVREGQAEWDSNTGQYLLALDVLVRDGSVLIVERAASNAPPAVVESGESASETLFEQALALEAADTAAAIDLYRRCLALNPAHTAAHINCARLLQQSGAIEEAEQIYRREASGDPHALYNLAVLLEDTGRNSEAVELYLAVIAADPGFAEAHYNLARHYEIQGNAPHMIRHLRQYRSLIGIKP